MTTIFHPYDVTQEEEIKESLDFNRRSRLKHVDQTLYIGTNNLDTAIDLC